MLFNSFTTYGPSTSFPVHPVNCVLIFAQVHGQTLRKERSMLKYFFCNNALFQVLRVLAKFRKVTVSFVLSVCPSARMAKSAPTGRIFVEVIFEYFQKISQEILSSLKFDKNNKCCT